jgi:DNA-binding LacI/PurR family transcriptional regulator
VALVGYDDTPSAEILDLSSVRQPLSEVGARILAALCPTDAQSAPAAVLLPPELIVRGTSRRRA